MCDVVSTEIRRCGAPIARRQVFEQFYPWPGGRSERGDAEPRSEDVVQVLLFNIEVLALAGHLQAQYVAIKGQCLIGVVDDDRRVIDAQEHAIATLLPLPLTLPRRKRDQLQEVPIGIAEIERADP